MKDKINLKLMFLACMVTFFLPWFTFDASIMGYRYGYIFLKWFAVPIAIIAVYLFAGIRNKAFLVLTELSMIANLALFVITFGRWQEVCNINTGFQWKDGFYTALPTFWMAVILHVFFFIMFQMEVIKREGRNSLDF